MPRLLRTEEQLYTSMAARIFACLISDSSDAFSFFCSFACCFFLHANECEQLVRKLAQAAERRMMEVHLDAGRVWLVARSDGGESDEEVGVNVLCEVSPSTSISG